MKNKIAYIAGILCLAILVACTSFNSADKHLSALPTTDSQDSPHEYGGWYCPDNLNGFPAVDISQWQNVPVVTGRLATQQETRTGKSLIEVDLKKYPNAKPLDIPVPQLARYKCVQTGKNEIIIVIQALNISNDSIVGFRYLNGGNGSARLNEINFLAAREIQQLAPTRFVSLDLLINAPQNKIFEILTQEKYYPALENIFDKHKTIQAPWNSSKVNYKYLQGGAVTSEYADELFGNKYIQIDYEKGDYQYVEKFLLLENEHTKQTKLQIVCGPFGADYENQKTTLGLWSQKVKELSEN